MVIVKARWSLSESATRKPVVFNVQGAPSGKQRHMFDLNHVLPDPVKLLLPSC
jgi:hypothetical protein